MGAVQARRAALQEDRRDQTHPVRGSIPAVLNRQERQRGTSVAAMHYRRKN